MNKKMINGVHFYPPLPHNLANISLRSIDLKTQIVIHQLVDYGLGFLLNILLSIKA